MTTGGKRIIEVVGAVGSVAEAYRSAHAAIVPIRAGGGTRIKVLEAFAYRRPVVATTIGVEGIAARHDEHLLVATQLGGGGDQLGRGGVVELAGQPQSDVPGVEPGGLDGQQLVRHLTMF